ncbi:MAG: hypothetical protein RIF41_17180 [Polyangiaceae bacterium]
MTNAWQMGSRAAGWLGITTALLACGNSTVDAVGPGGGGSGTGASGGQGAEGGQGGEADPGPQNPLEFEGPMPDFSLTDVNGSSATFDQSVSVRDHEGQVSAWYFAHAT